MSARARTRDQERTCRLRRMGQTVCVAGLLVAASCSSSTDPTETAAEGASAETTATPETTTPTTSTPTSTTLGEERRPFKGTVSGQPSYLAPGAYRSAGLRVDLVFDIPETETRVRWNGLYDLEHQMLMLLTTPEPVPGDDPSAVPGMSVVAPQESLNPATAVEAILAATPTSGGPFFTAEPGQFLGLDATVVRGTLSQDVAFRSDGQWSVALPDGTSFVLLEQPERKYLMFVFELDGQTLIVEMNAHPDQFDLVLTEGLRIAESLREGQ